MFQLCGLTQVYSFISIVVQLSIKLVLLFSSTVRTLGSKLLAIGHLPLPRITKQGLSLSPRCNVFGFPGWVGVRRAARGVRASAEPVRER